MRVGIVAPLSIAMVNGGVRTQALKTAEALIDLGVHVEFISPWEPIADIDLVHVFTASPETLGIITRCNEMGIDVVLSPVFYANRSAPTISKVLFIEKILSRLGSGIRSEFGIKAEACRRSTLILPNTKDEALLIQQGFGLHESSIKVVPNGVEESFLNATPDLFIETYGIKEFILFAGQAGAKRKNVRSLLKAATNLDYDFVIIGSFHNDEYGVECKQLANASPNVTLINTLNHDSPLLSSAYAACHSFILPSYFETPGIAAMEAALAGAHIVITEYGGTKEYFAEHAEFINPKSIESITQGLLNCMRKPKSELLRKHIHSNFSWEQVALKTLEAYKSL